MDQHVEKVVEKIDLLRVLVIDDHLLISDMMVFALSADHGFDVKVVTTSQEGLDMIASDGPFDIVLLDYELPNSDGLTTLRKVIDANNGKVVIFSGVAGMMIIQRALEIGAAGYIPKTIQLSTLRNILRLVAGGETYVPMDFIRKMALSEDTPFALKPRELLVLELLGEGLQNKEIGRALDLEETTVKMDVRSICKKLDVHNRTQAVISARQHGLI